SRLDDARAVQAMTTAMASSCDVSGAAHLPAHVALRFSGIGGSSATAFRLEGVAPSVKHRRDALAALLKPYGDVAPLDEKASRKLWLEIRDVLPFSSSRPSGDRPVWRVSVPPARGFELGALIEPSAQMFYDWAGGLIWIAPLPTDDAGAAMVRKAIASLGGHATLVRAPAAVRAAVDVFEPQPAPVAALTKRVKESFDPKGVLNPGRMWAGV
ncbi:MAG: 2-hydroxy-acid oxidase, partial [Microvirga sp.]